jgi:hypothetical protein
LLREDLVHPAATHCEVGVSKLRIVLRQRDCDMIRPSAQTVGAGGMWVADTLSERVAERHVSADGHETNLADAMANFSTAARGIGELTSAVPPLFASM